MFMCSQQTPKVLADLILCLSEICRRFDVILSTTKVEYSLFLQLDESITLIWVLPVCVAKEFISILWKTFTRTCKFFNDICTYLFYKQLGSGLSPQSCLYFQSVHSSK